MSPNKKNQWETIFKHDIFVLKHGLDHAKSITAENFFFEKFSIFWAFLAIVEQKMNV